MFPPPQAADRLGAWAAGVGVVVVWVISDLADSKKKTGATSGKRYYMSHRFIVDVF
jgi:hypothetical protein